MKAVHCAGQQHLQHFTTQVSLNGTNAVQATVTVTMAQHTTPGQVTLTFDASSGTAAHSMSVGLTIN